MTKIGSNIYYPWFYESVTKKDEQNSMKFIEISSEISATCRH